MTYSTKSASASTSACCGRGEPNVTLESDGLLATDPLFMEALETERQQIESEFEDYKAWPVISLGFNYQFM